jgi:hypothetical protein
LPDKCPSQKFATILVPVAIGWLGDILGLRSAVERLQPDFLDELDCYASLGYHQTGRNERGLFGMNQKKGIYNLKKSIARA